MITYRFYLRLANNKETHFYENGDTFKECLKRANERAAINNGRIIGWEEV